ncbi:MAG: thermonuclease family protein [Deltaproteobacteria bacterium]|nr:thermonuclease family protein [Deltaproteobacteria bacterium]
MPCRFRSLVLLAVLSCLLHSCRDEPPAAARRPGLDGPYEVTRVVDGDTIHVSLPLGSRKVRFVCIDTPEVRGQKRSPLGKSATSALRDLLDGGEVYLAVAQAHDDADRYGRLLRHVFLEDGTHLNLELVRAGWSAYYTKYGACPGYHVRFLEAEEESRTSGVGIWAHPDFLDGGYLDNARGGEAR